MIGNTDDAAAAFAGTLPYLGEGCTRRVYVSEDLTTVYKVDYYDVEPDHNSNRSEYERAGTLNLPAPYVVPPMTLYPNGVLAMPYYNGTHMGECYCLPGESHYGCHDETTRAYLSTIGADCATWGNTIMLDTGEIVLIDLA